MKFPLFCPDPLNSRFLSARDCKMEIKQVRIALQRLFSASKSVLSAWSMVFLVLRRSSKSFQVAMCVVCSRLRSWLFRSMLTFGQFDSPSVINLYSFFENNLQQKQYRESNVFGAAKPGPFYLFSINYCSVEIMMMQTSTIFSLGKCEIWANLKWSSTH